MNLELWFKYNDLRKGENSTNYSELIKRKNFYLNSVIFTPFTS